MNYANLLALTFIEFFGFISCHTPKQVCYGGLGCFSNNYPFYDPVLRPIDTLPDSPQEIDTEFLLYSYTNQLPQVLDPQKTQSIKYSTLSKKFKVKIIIHGFVEDYHQTNQWINNLVKILLKSEPLNVIVVDWIDGADSYPRSVANSRVVGTQVAQLITTLKRLVSTPLSSIELIGHDVGAQVASYAGLQLKGSLGRIKGILPARLYFDGLPNEVKLDGSDAQVVEIIDDSSQLLIETADTHQKHFIPRLG